MARRKNSTGIGLIRLFQLMVLQISCLLVILDVFFVALRVVLGYLQSSSD